MRLDHTGRPISQHATRVMFACFIGFCVLGLADAMREHGRRSAWWWAAGWVVAFFFLGALVTYFRPRGIAAFFTSTAYVAIVGVGGASIGMNKLLHLSESASLTLTAVLFVAYLLYGLRQVREAKRAARSTR